MNTETIVNLIFDTFSEQQESATISGNVYKALPLASLSGAFDVIPGGRPESYEEAFAVKSSTFNGNPETAKFVTWRGNKRLVSNIDRKQIAGAIIFFLTAPNVPR